MAGTLIETQAELEALFGPVGEASLRKEVDHLHPVYRRWIEASPFAVLATSGPNGLDASPRGDPAPLVRVVDAHTLLLPERRGNNRVDSLRNLLADPRMALLFFVPGVGETVRVNGRAEISVEPALLASLAMDGALPRCVLRIQVESVFFQCARAMLRSGLWAGPHAARAAMKGAPPAAGGETASATAGSVPSAGTILAALSGNQVGGEAYDRELPSRQRATLY
jgi:PPOX class probable FMN-dependent enzyme